MHVHILKGFFVTEIMSVCLCEAHYVRRMKTLLSTGGLDSTLYCKQEWPLPDCGASPQKRSSREPSDQSEYSTVIKWQVFFY